jgi:ubiquinone biosynthesis protein
MIFTRIAKIAHTIRVYGLARYLPRRVPVYARVLLWLVSIHRPVVKAKAHNRGIALRLTLEELGPIFIKFGQLLSTRRDLLADDIADELEKLQDKVAPFASDLAKEIIEASLGKKTDELFASFESTPLASASVAQVHGAVLDRGESVVVKIIRPNIEKIIAKDLAWMRSLARVLTYIWPDSKRLNLAQVINNYADTIYGELDLTQEAASATRIRRNFIESDLLYIPQVYWQYTHANILVLERIDAIAVTDIASLEKYKIDRSVLAKKGIEIFLTQVFRDGFFHADMHPGNILVAKTNPDNPSYMGVDFGIVGSLSEQDQFYLIHLLLAFFTQDYNKIAHLYIDAGWVESDTDVNKFAMYISVICEPIFGQSMAQMSYGKALLKLFTKTKEFNLRVQPQLLLFQKTLFNIEGLGKRLAPELDIFTELEPLLRQLLKDKVGIGSLLEQAVAHYPAAIAQLPHVATWLKTQLQPAQPSKTSKKIELQLAIAFVAGILLSAIGYSLFQSA